MHVLITGASGTVGRFLAHRMLEDGHAVTALGRRRPGNLPVAFVPYDLADTAPVLPAADALIHCALSHEPGKYRGGEGQDPEGFRRLNVTGTKALFEAARERGCRRAVFLSSRAVYGDHRAGEVLRESDEAAPDTLYGQVKLAGETLLEALCDRDFSGCALRATGVYGVAPGLPDHKWSGLFDSFLAGESVGPRCGTEVHGADLASAAALLLTRAGDVPPFEVFNVSDLLLDRGDLLAMLRTVSGKGGEPPPACSTRPGIMDTTRLRALGWSPGGEDRLRSFLQTCCNVS